MNKYCKSAATNVQASYIMYSYSQSNISLIHGYLMFSSTFYSSDEYHKTQGKCNTQV